MREWQVEATITIHTMVICEDKDEAEYEAHELLTEMCESLDLDRVKFEIDKVYHEEE